MKKTYWEKLKDPRWQRKRLEAMAKAEFACEICMDSESTLNVHHKQYFKGREPWEYDVGQLAVICEDCHKFEHESDDVLNTVCSYLPLDGPCSRESVAAFVAGYAGLEFPKEDTDPFSHCSGLVARNVLSSYRRFGKDLMDLASFSESHGDELFGALLECMKSNAPEGMVSK